MRYLRCADTISLLVLSAAAIVILAADFAGLLGRIGFLSSVDYPKLVLVLLAGAGLHLGVAHLTRLSFYDRFPEDSETLLHEITTRCEQLVESVHGVQVTIFADAAEQELYVARRLEEATVEVCDLSWKEKMSLQSAMPRRVSTHKTYEGSIVRAAKRVPYREVFIFSDTRRIEKLRRRIQEKTTGYSCRYFPSPCSIPRLQFVLIDRQEIVFASSAYPKLCAIRQAELSELFQAYFEDIWKAATPLKEGALVCEEEVERVIASGPQAETPRAI